MTEPKLQSPKTQAFANIWYAAQKTSALDIPLKTDLPLRDLAPLMSQIALIELPEGQEARYALFGTGLVEDFGMDLTGQALTKSMHEETRAHVAAEFLEFYTKHDTDTPFGRWVFGTGRATTGRSVHYESLTLPYREPSTAEKRFIMYATPLSVLTFEEILNPVIHEIETIIFPAIDHPRPEWLQFDPSMSLVQSVGAEGKIPPPVKES